MLTPEQVWALALLVGTVPAAAVLVWLADVLVGWFTDAPDAQEGAGRVR